MFALSAVGVPAKTTTAAKKARKYLIEQRNNVMQHSPVVVPMCVQHSQQQVPMLDNSMCMRMRGWLNSNIHCTNCFNTKLTLGTGTGTGTTGTIFTKNLKLKLKLKRSKLLRQKRDIIHRRRITYEYIRF
ncbi:hypothetical protein KR009_008612 [Drosophila setifemur]|nr:hypothetical protein KR009_008612 [Drosophila setifemur]